MKKKYAHDLATDRGAAGFALRRLRTIETPAL